MRCHQALFLLLKAYEWFRVAGHKWLGVTDGTGIKVVVIDAAWAGGTTPAAVSLEVHIPDAGVQALEPGQEGRRGIRGLGSIIRVFRLWI